MTDRDELAHLILHVETRDLGGVTQRDSEEIADAILARYVVVSRPPASDPTTTERGVPDAVLAKHGLRSHGERPTPTKLREMADAFVAAAWEADNTERSNR